MLYNYAGQRDQCGILGSLPAGLCSRKQVVSPAYGSQHITLSRSTHAHKIMILHCYCHALFCRRSLGNILLVALLVDWRHSGWRLAVAVCQHQPICGNTLTRLAAALAARKSRLVDILSGTNSSHYVNNTQFSWRMKHLIA